MHNFVALLLYDIVPLGHVIMNEELLEKMNTSCCVVVQVGFSSPVALLRASILANLVVGSSFKMAVFFALISIKQLHAFWEAWCHLQLTYEC